MKGALGGCSYRVVPTEKLQKLSKKGCRFGRIGYFAQPRVGQNILKTAVEQSDALRGGIGKFVSIGPAVELKSIGLKYRLLFVIAGLHFWGHEALCLALNDVKRRLRIELDQQIRYASLWTLYLFQRERLWLEAKHQTVAV